MLALVDLGHGAPGHDTTMYTRSSQLGVQVLSRRVIKGTDETTSPFCAWTPRRGALAHHSFAAASFRCLSAIADMLQPASSPARPHRLERTNSMLERQVADQDREVRPGDPQPPVWKLSHILRALWAILHSMTRCFADPMCHTVDRCK